jgi:hypothetical protein
VSHSENDDDKDQAISSGLESFTVCFTEVMHAIQERLRHHDHDLRSVESEVHGPATMSCLMPRPFKLISITIDVTPLGYLNCRFEYPLEKPAAFHGSDRLYACTVGVDSLPCGMLNSCCRVDVTA